ncbi:MAG TPA: hypothetical protein VF069_07585 [Streptosporangiaceae bacterium]
MSVVELANEATPYVTAAIGAYGTAVLTKAKDEAADASVTLGRRILRRLLRDRKPAAAAPLESAVAELADDTDNADVREILTIRIKQLLAADDALAADVREMLAEAGGIVTASGDRSIAAQDISGIAQTGDHARAEQRNVDGH